ncbi:hypothetical protein H9L01_08280 [Erysipelothrix inopinata]|uniref:Uncharacterized protein n=1 Tax=Erysipelothrix inopinata TaxID=225084 RepID=A0A7G9RXN6_9FIRM|nr:hypothetical protein [Erysipelothrix inopinata]QNN60361.1 hypothetical protein H9L01_08280 [Erysipelothrix inopinata]
MITIIKEQLPKLKMLFLGAGLILFTQFVKLIKNPASTPITMNTIMGLIVLVLFAYIGLLIAELMKKTGVKVLADFPVLGWVSVTSLIFCLISDFFIQAISGVDFLSITTPVLAFAGISVADNLGDLSKNSWKYIIVALFVFLGSYLGRAILAQLGIMIAG